MLREANQQEWTAIADLTKAAYQEYAAEADPAFWSAYEVGTREALLADADIVRILAIENDQIAGTVVYVPPYENKIGEHVIKNPYPEMRLLSVLPRFRNRGFGDQLITACESRARNEGYNAITLHTTRLMSVAKEMYKRRGYSRFQAIDFEPVAGFVVWGYIKYFHAGT